MSFPSFTRKNQANWCKLLQLLSLQTSPQNFFFSLPIPSLCPASFFLLPKAKLASYVHLYALWSNLRLCLILIFHSLNLVLLPFDPKIFKSDLTSKPFSEALLPIYWLPSYSPSSFFTSKDLKGVVCTPRSIFLTSYSFLSSPKCPPSSITHGFLTFKVNGLFSFCILHDLSEVCHSVEVPYPPVNGY